MSDSLGGNSPATPLGPNTPLPGGAPMDAPVQNQGPPPGAGVQPPNTPAEAHDIITKHHSRMKSAYEQSGKALKTLGVVKKGLDFLSDKADTVTFEDVISEAAKLVGHGIDPRTLAGMLADAPQQGGGQALAGWINQGLQNVTQALAQMNAQHSMDRHHMGLAALNSAMSSHVMEALGQGPLPIPSPENALNTQGPEMGPQAPLEGGGGNSLSG